MTETSFEKILAGGADTNKDPIYFITNSSEKIAARPDIYLPYLFKRIVDRAERVADGSRWRRKHYTVPRYLGQRFKL